MYFAVNKFKEEINVSPSPSPSPQTLEFIINKPQPSVVVESAPSFDSSSTSLTAGAQGKQQPPPQKSVTPSTQAQNQGSGLPLERNKYVGHFPGILRVEVLYNKKAVIDTAKGKFELEIYPEASKAASNFMLLSVNGFYNGLTFHRVEPGFVVQGGDPLGDGRGGPGYTFEDEVIIREYVKGIVAYANAGPNTNGSQFFILLSDHPELPKRYTIFGNVISGMDVVEKLSPGDVMKKVTIEALR